MKLIALLLVFCQIRDGDGSFGKPFYKFLEKAYGIEAANVLDRPDFGNDGSYGGGKGTVSRRPVIIVHGVTNTAMTFKFVRNFLLKSNYTDEEIYGTTWGDGGRRFILWVRLECQYIKQVRVLIQSVVDFTGSKVDVLAYSMGSPISRKAILGGNCGPEDIGPPLTDLIETFVGVAGANYGSDLCFVSFGICNTENGLHCESKMLSHINTQPAKYEARRVYAIYSTADNKVGLDCCGTNCSMIPHSDGQFIFDRWDHDQIMYETLELQLDLIKRA